MRRAFNPFKVILVPSVLKRSHRLIDCDGYRWYVRSDAPEETFWAVYQMVQDIRAWADQRGRSGGSG